MEEKKTLTQNTDELQDKVIEVEAFLRSEQVRVFVYMYVYVCILIYMGVMSFAPSHRGGIHAEHIQTEMKIRRYMYAHTHTRAHTHDTDACSCCSFSMLIRCFTCSVLYATHIRTHTFTQTSIQGKTLQRLEAELAETKMQLAKAEESVDEYEYEVYNLQGKVADFKIINDKLKKIVARKKSIQEKENTRVRSGHPNGARDDAGVGAGMKGDRAAEAASKKKSTNFFGF